MLEFLRFIWSVLSLQFVLLGGCVLTVLVGLLEKYFFKHQLSLRGYTGIILALLFFACFQSWQQERRSRLGREVDLHKQEGMTLTETRKLDGCELSLRTAQDSLNRNQGAIDARSSQLAAQQASLDSCLVQLGKVQQTEPAKVTLLMGPATPDLKRGKYSKIALALVTKTIVRPRGMLICNKPLKEAHVWVFGSGLQTGGAGNAMGNAVRFDITSPAASPIAPLAFTLFYDDVELEQCSIALERID